MTLVRPLADELWLPVQDFDAYEVSDQGRVRNRNTGHVLSQTQGRTGYYVGLVSAKDRTKYNRAVNRLVAEAFVAKPNEYPVWVETFDTPIHLDGNRLNNHASNLMWRPIWFAMDYHKQFKDVGTKYMIVVMELNSFGVFTSCWDAAVHYGILARDVWMSVKHSEPVWPVSCRFAETSGVPITSVAKHAL